MAVNETGYVIGLPEKPQERLHLWLEKHADDLVYLLGKLSGPNRVASKILALHPDGTARACRFVGQDLVPYLQLDGNCRIKSGADL